MTVVALSVVVKPMTAVVLAVVAVIEVAGGQ
jgi:hypothetical protein